MKKNFKRNSSKRKVPTSFLGKTWHFIWHDDSILSWFVNVILAFLIVKFIFYPLLSLALGSSLPLVAVTSSSMEHRVSSSGDVNSICGTSVDFSGRPSFDVWWSVCGKWYEENTNISFEEFKSFPMTRGFNKGDIILLVGTNNLEVGDVIVFQAAKEYPIIHRIINISEDNIVTKGDNNQGLIVDSQLNERRVSPSVVLGKAYLRIPYLGYVKIWFTDFINLFR
ncbi:MAG: signal peptidase I [Candidatus Woesearchaeota archaeon]